MNLQVVVCIFMLNEFKRLGLNSRPIQAFSLVGLRCVIYAYIYTCICKYIYISISAFVLDSLKFYERDPLLQEIRKRYRFATFQEAGLNERFFLGPCRVVPTITSSILTCFSDIDCRRGLGGSTSRLSAGSLLQNPCEASLGIASHYLLSS